MRRRALEDAHTNVQYATCGTPLYAPRVNRKLVNWPLRSARRRCALPFPNSGSGWRHRHELHSWSCRVNDIVLGRGPRRDAFEKALRDETRYTTRRTSFVGVPHDCARRWAERGLFRGFWLNGRQRRNDLYQRYCLRHSAAREAHFAAARVNAKSSAGAPRAWHCASCPRQE